MKIWKRYMLAFAMTSGLTILLTFLVYKHVKLKFEPAEPLKRSELQKSLSHNRNPVSVFYDLYDKSPLYDELKKLDRKKASKAAVKRLLLTPAALELHKRHGIIVGLSDILPLNRPIPDSRPRGCSSKDYPDSLPTVGIVIPFYNEWPSILLRTVYSIIDRTPTHLLKEVILVDDNSNLPGLQAHFAEVLEKLFSLSLVKLKRLRTRSGLIVARLEGLKYITADTVSFFDSHMEVNENWLPPLLAEIKKNRKTVAMSQLDYINKDTLTYEYDPGYRTRYGFDWKLLFFETYFRADTLDGKSDSDPVPGVVMVGPGAVVDVQYFKEIGAFDEGMVIWGGENLEFPWRVWLCGGQMIHVPCSHIGHIARSQPYHFPQGRMETENHNYKRAVEVWMDEYKAYVYEANPDIKTIDAGDLSERLALKERLQCKPFKWFLQNVWPELLTYKENSLAWGSVKVIIQGRPRSTNICLDNEDYLFSVPNPLMARLCTGSVTRQMMSLTSDRLLRTILQCVVVKGSFLSDKIPHMQGCYEGEKETWTHTGPGLLKHDQSDLCMQLTERSSLVMAMCDEKNKRQHWIFNHYNPANNPVAVP